MVTAELVTSEIVITAISEAYNKGLFVFCMFLLLLLGLYIFYISPKKSKIIKEQEMEINRLKEFIE